MAKRFALATNESTDMDVLSVKYTTLPFVVSRFSRGDITSVRKYAHIMVNDTIIRAVQRATFESLNFF